MKSCFVIFALVISGGAFAQGVKVQKALTAANEAAEKNNKSLQESCGHTVKVKFDDSLKADAAAAETASWCLSSLKGMATLCKDADYKPSVTKIKEVVCKFDKTLTKENSYANKFELNGSTLTHAFNTTSFNIEDKTVEFLKSKFD